jgi:DNA processing protein
MSNLDDLPSFLRRPAISPLWEMGAYEALWLNEKATFKTIADLFRKSPGDLPSSFVEVACIKNALNEVVTELASKAPDYQVRVHGSHEYPDRLRDAKHPIEFFYFRGWWDLVNAPGSVRRRD